MRDIRPLLRPVECRRSGTLVDYAADPRHVQFVSNPDGSFKAVVEFAVLVDDDQGQIINSINRVAVANVDSAKKREHDQDRHALSPGDQRAGERPLLAPCRRT
jgi:hypothetical protein